MRILYKFIRYGVFAMSVTKEQVESALKQYIDPHLEKDPVTAGVVKNIEIDGANDGPNAG